MTEFHRSLYVIGIEQVQDSTNQCTAYQSRPYWLHYIRTPGVHLEKDTYLEHAHEIERADSQARAHRRSHRPIARRQENTQANVDSNRDQRVEEREPLIPRHQQHIANSTCSGIDHTAYSKCDEQRPCSCKAGPR